MKDGKCTKKFHRKLVKMPTGHDGYPLYRRRKTEDGGFTAQIIARVGGRQEQVENDNRWILSHCPLLSCAYNSHINIEF